LTGEIKFNKPAETNEKEGETTNKDDKEANKDNGDKNDRTEKSERELEVKVETYDGEHNKLNDEYNDGEIK